MPAPQDTQHNTPRPPPPHVLVTGGGRGIGAAIARRLVADGLRVTVLGRTLASVQALAREHPDRMHAVCADVAQPAQIAQALADARARFGPITVLVNNAGQVETAPFLHMDAALWQRMLDVNLTGTMVCTQAALPDMLAAGWGRIVNIASTAAQTGYAYVTAYCAAKHGMLGLTRALAQELATKSITVNAVCPGYTDTDLVRDSVAHVAAKTGRSQDATLATFLHANPQHRLIEPAEVADTVSWLCGAGASAMTGQAISVCAGELMP